MCAAWLQMHGRLSVAVVEGNSRVGAKLKVSGGGKCNITNTDVRPLHYLGDEAMLAQVLAHFGKEELLGFLKHNGIDPVVRKGRYYFCRDSSDEIIDLLRRLGKGCDYRLGYQIEGVAKNGEGFVVTTDRERFGAQRVVVASGGVSFKTLGATGIGLDIAASFGHSVKPFSPALVGLTLQPSEFWMRELSGISFPVRIVSQGRVIEEDMLFAHKGISGPAVLSASLYWHKGSITVDFLPDKRADALCKGSKKLISSAIPLPKRFMKQFLQALELEDKPCTRLSSSDMQKLMQLHEYVFAPSGSFGFTKAEVSRGGVLCDEIDAATMQSRRCDGLYFIGEVVDITGELGGYNFQWAFSSAVTAADDLLKRC